MFTGVTLSILNYDNLLEGWAALSLQTGVTFDGGRSHYTNATARQHIIDTFGWTIIDGGFVDLSSPPYINSPDDISYEFGSTGNEITWAVSDFDPEVYNVTLDGSLYVSDTLWRNGLIDVNIDGLDMGIHTLTIYVYDAETNMVSDTVGILVDDELSVDSPDDFSYEENSIGNIITWTVNSHNPNIYNVTLDGSLYVSDTLWSNGIIDVNIDGLDIGVYTFTIYVYNAIGSIETDTVEITVITTSETTTSETTTSETTGSISDGEPSLDFPQVAVFVISFVSITIIQRLRKKLT
jgi:hypothetical protein